VGEQPQKAFLKNIVNIAGISDQRGYLLADVAAVVEIDLSDLGGDIGGQAGGSGRGRIVKKSFARRQMN
jgi:hypothetical protein